MINILLPFYPPCDIVNLECVQRWRAVTVGIIIQRPGRIQPRTWMHDSLRQMRTSRSSARNHTSAIPRMRGDSNFTSPFGGAVLGRGGKFKSRLLCNDYSPPCSGRLVRLRIRASRACDPGFKSRPEHQPFNRWILSPKAVK